MTNAFRIRRVLLALLFCAATFAFVMFHLGAFKVFFISLRVRAELAPAMAENHFEWGSPVYIRIFKESKQLELWMRRGGAYALFDVYPVCSYSGTLGRKISEGDRQAPEGFYAIHPAAMNANSAFHLSFDLGFPNAYDRAHKATGSDLMVHGSCVSAGCYAMTDAGIDKIYTLMKAAFDAGQPEIPVHIFPFRLTHENLLKHRASEWTGWWESLAPVYEDFEKTHDVPAVGVRDGKYVLESGKL